MKKICFVFICLFVFTGKNFAQYWAWAEHTAETTIQSSAASVVTGVDVALDPSGNPFITGSIADDVLFGGTTTISTSNTSQSYDVYVAKLNSFGLLQWVRQFPGTLLSSAESHGLDNDNLGNIVVAGEFLGTIMTGSDTLNSAGGQTYNDVFVTKISGSNTIVWSKRAGSMYSDGATGVCSDNNNNTFVTGYFSGNASFDSFTINAVPQTNNTFIAKYDTSGNCLWVKSAVASGDYVISRSVSCDAAGNAYVFGTMKDTAWFGTTMIAVNGSSYFIAKYSAAGNLIRVVTDGIYDSDIDAKKIVCDDNGRTYICASFDDSVHVGNSVLTSVGYSDCFLACYDSAGTFIWNKHISGTGDNFIEDLDIDLFSDDLVMAGVSINGNMNFGSLPLSVLPSGNAPVIARCDEMGNMSFADKANEQNGNGWNHGVAAMAGGVYVVTGDFVYSLSFGQYQISTASWSSDVYTARFNAPYMSVDDQNTHALLLYPNPADDYLMIQTNELNDKNTVLKIYDLLGQQVHCEKNTDGYLIRIETSHLAKGMYELELISGEKRYSAKFIH